MAPGNRFAIAFDITPKRGMHVYAPGASSYRVISVKGAEQPFVRALAPKYPQSEIYHFKPLDERVPVFQRPFRLVQSMAVSTSPDARAALKGLEAVTISGSLEYQACDDRLCFTPRSIPVSYTVRLRQLDTERATTPK